MSWFKLSFIPSNLGIWPRVSNLNYKWLKRVTVAKETDWKWCGIFDAINLTYHDVELNYPLILSFLRFWSTATNTFVFSFSFMLTHWQVHQIVSSSKVLGSSSVNPQRLCWYLDWFKPNLQAKDKEFKIEDKER